jgi:inosine/xanthosine triphosphatase
MKIGLGSTNEAKIEAAERAVEDFLDSRAIDGLEVESPDQPISVEEAREGAISGAKQAYNKGYELGIGNEGFVTEIDGEYFLSTVTILYEDGNIVGEGYSGMIKLPKDMQDRISEGEELGEVIIDEIGDDISEEGGAISVLTNERKARAEFTYSSMLHAFSDRQYPSI